MHNFLKDRLTFKEFAAEWQLVVGVGIFTSQVVNVILEIVFWILDIITNLYYKSKSMILSEPTYDSTMDAIKGPTYDLVDNFVWYVVSMAVCITFSGGMPTLLFIMPV